MVSQLELPQFPQEEGGQVHCFGDLIPMEGTHAKWCHAKSAAYVRDAKPEGDVHSNLPKQRSPLENRDLTLWRFGFRVREKNGARPCTAKGCSHFYFRQSKQSSVGADPGLRPKNIMSTCLVCRD